MNGALGTELTEYSESWISVTTEYVIDLVPNKLLRTTTNPSLGVCTDDENDYFQHLMKKTTHCLRFCIPFFVRQLLVLFTLT